MRTETEIVRDMLTMDPVDPDRFEEGGGGDRCEIFLAYSDWLSLRVAGFLVCKKGEIDSVIAFCPVAGETRKSPKLLVKEVFTQLRLARRVARDPKSFINAGEVLWLENMGEPGRPVPNWVYGLNCVPLERPSDGKFLHPRPFCPALFESMATQAKAASWLKVQAMSKVRPRGRVGGI